MSFYYSKVLRKPEVSPTYGFRKVEDSEIAGILQRVTRATLSSRLQTGESNSGNENRSSREQPFNISQLASNTNHSSMTPQIQNKRQFTDWELQRILKRIQRPTEASNYRSKHIIEDSTSVTKIKARGKVTDDRGEALERLIRPTTASRAKRVTREYWFCEGDEGDEDEASQYSSAHERRVLRKDIDKTVCRLRSPTFASVWGQKVCKCSPNAFVQTIPSARLPLVSGLARSSNVLEIVARLHRKKRHGYRSAPTPLHPNM